MHAAVFRAPLPVFRDLIERGADVNVALSSDPKLNVMERYLDENSKADPAVVKLLLEKGFDQSVLSEKLKAQVAQLI